MEQQLPRPCKVLLVHCNHEPDKPTINHQPAVISRYTNIRTSENKGEILFSHKCELCLLQWNIILSLSLKISQHNCIIFNSCYLKARTETGTKQFINAEETDSLWTAASSTIRTGAGQCESIDKQPNCKKNVAPFTDIEVKTFSKVLMNWYHCKDYSSGYSR